LLSNSKGQLAISRLENHPRMTEEFRMGAITLQEKFTSDSVRSFEPGETVFNEGDDSREMFVVLQGTVEVVKVSSRGEIKLAKISRGSFLARCRCWSLYLEARQQEPLIT
jgi:5-deoxy-D-glucuronate isomerase